MVKKRPEVEENFKKMLILTPELKNSHPFKLLKDSMKVVWTFRYEEKEELRWFVLLVILQIEFLNKLLLYGDACIHVDRCDTERSQDYHGYDYSVPFSESRHCWILRCNHSFHIKGASCLLNKDLLNLTVFLLCFSSPPKALCLLEAIYSGQIIPTQLFPIKDEEFGVNANPLKRTCNE